MNDTTTSSSNTDDDYWIGIDWGTTNCTAAIYCPSLGRSKWMRLSLLVPSLSLSVLVDSTTNSIIHDLTEIQNPQQPNSKVGHIVPSVYIFATSQFLDENTLNVSSSDDCRQPNDDDSRIVRLQYNNNQKSSTTTKMKQNYYIWQSVTELLSFETQSVNTNDLRKLGL